MSVGQTSRFGARTTGWAWERRHLRIRLVLAAHVPGLLVFGLARGFGLVHVIVDIVPVVVCLALATSPRLAPRLRSVAAAVGLMSAAASFVHLADGRTEAHFLYFVLLGVLALYDDWVPYAAAVLFVLLDHGIMGIVAPDAVWGSDGAGQASWTWTAVHGGFVLAASVVAFVSWRWRDAERTEAEQLLRISEDHFRITFEAAAVGMALVGLDGRFLRVNQALCKIVDYSAEALVATTFQAITHPDDLDLDLAQLQRCLDGEIDGYEMEKRYFHRDGTVVWVQLNVAVAHDANGAPAHFVAQILDITQRRNAAAALAASEARFAHLASHDALTGLPNRVLLQDRTAHARAAAIRHGEVLAVLYVDVDHFKDVNDLYGHGFGDLVLLEVANRLRTVARAGETIARLGGDEFVMVASLPDDSAARSLAARICNAFIEPFTVDGRTIAVTVSVGLATSDDTDDDIEQLEAADLAMYEAKAIGRASWVSYMPHMRRRERGVAASPEPDPAARY